MRHILRRHEIVADDWRYFGEPLSAGSGGASCRWRSCAADPEAWQQRPARLGVRLRPPTRRGSAAATCRGWRWWPSNSPAPGTAAATA